MNLIGAPLCAAALMVTGDPLVPPFAGEHMLTPVAVAVQLAVPAGGNVSPTVTYSVLLSSVPFASFACTVKRCVPAAALIDTSMAEPVMLFSNAPSR